MDMGVGAFVFAQGVASALPLLRDPNHLSGWIVPKVLRSVQKTSPLILLGLIRLLLVKSTDYPGVRSFPSCVIPIVKPQVQEHVSEYGTHWNFFLTLAVIPPLQMALQPLFQFFPVNAIGIAVAISESPK
jgi:phosphatidylinositol glycan class W